MELRLTPELEADIARIAAHEGQTTEQFLVGVARHRVDDEMRRQNTIRERLVHLDDTQLIDHEAMRIRFHKMLQD